MIAKDYSGQKFGKLMTISLAYRNGKKAFYNFECECGILKIIRMDSVQGGKIKSCGCIKNLTKNDYERSLLAKINNQKTRCRNKNATRYEDWGGRGIEFRFSTNREAFKYYLTLGLPPSPEHSLDRLDNDGHYEIGNIGWATKQDQCLNRRKMKGTSSKYRGVRKLEKNWLSQIVKDKKVFNLGRFDHELDAAYAYLEKYYEFYKKLPPEYKNTALLNFPTHRGENVFI